MQLINALTNARNLGVDTRMHIRNEMMAAGLRKLLPALRNSIDPRLRLHISLWEKNSKWDIQEIRARCVAMNAAGRISRIILSLYMLVSSLSSVTVGRGRECNAMQCGRRIQKVRLDYHDIEEVFRMVEDLTTSTKANYEFQRLLQSLLVTPQYVVT
jgi:hypothetical protein